MPVPEPVEPTPPGVTAYASPMLDLAALSELAEVLDQHALAANTRRGYDSRWSAWQAWCTRHQRTPLPADPADVRLYLVDLASQIRPDGTPRLKASSIGQHLAAISRVHAEHGHSLVYGGSLARHPVVASTYAGLRRLRREPRRAATPMLTDQVRRLCAALPRHVWPAGVGATRDHLALLLGFGAALRRSEAAALDVADTWLDPHAVDPQGRPGAEMALMVRLRHSKTDQEGAGMLRAIPRGEHVLTCAPCAWIRWIALLAVPAEDKQGPRDPITERMRIVFGRAPDTDGEGHLCGAPDSAEIASQVPSDSPLLRAVDKAGTIAGTGISGGALARMLTRRMSAAGMDPTGYGAHSLRAGFVTQARRNGADHRSVRRQTGQRSDATVEIYDRDWNPLSDNAVTTLGL